MKHLKTILGVMVLALAISCTKNHAEGDGQVSFVLESDFEVVDQTKSSVSQFTTLPSSGDFTITITDASSAPVWSGKISDWDPATLLQAGNYKVTATYGSLEEEGFDKPYFTGSADFAIQGAQTTEVKISVSLGNTVVLLSCTDNFKNYYQDYSFKLSRGNTDIVTFAKGETKAAFVDGYQFTLSGTIVGPTKTQTFSKEYRNLNEATAYTIIFDVANVGSSTITISFNGNPGETIDLGDVELND